MTNRAIHLLLSFFSATTHAVGLPTTASCTSLFANAAVWRQWRSTAALGRVTGTPPTAIERTWLLPFLRAKTTNPLAASYLERKRQVIGRHPPHSAWKPARQVAESTIADFVAGKQKTAFRHARRDTINSLNPSPSTALLLSPIFEVLHDPSSLPSYDPRRWKPFVEQRAKSRLKRSVHEKRSHPTHKNIYERRKLLEIFGFFQQSPDNTLRDGCQN